MQTIRRHLRPIGYATALALVLTGCASNTIKVEATDFSAVATDSDRAVFENLVGTPFAIEQSRGFTVAAYHYDRGHLSTYTFDVPGLGAPPDPASFVVGSVILLPALVLLGAVAKADYASERADAQESQRGQLAAVFGKNEKLVFLGMLDGESISREVLADFGAQFRAAQSGDAGALFELGMRAILPEQKQMMLAKAAEAEHPGALYEFGALSTDEVLQIRLWEKSAHLGYGPAAKEMGNRYLDGRGVDRNFERARELINVAATSGDPSAQALSDQLNKQKEEFEQSLALARAGDSKAQYELSKHYYQGRGVTESNEQSFDWLKLAVDRGHSTAQYELADRYLAGKGTQQNVELALYWYERAAENQNTSAQYTLGTLFDFRNEVAHNPVEAIKWYSIASLKYTPAKYRLDSLISKTPSDQVLEARSLSRLWLQAHPQ